MSSLKDIMDVDLEPLESQARRSRQAAQQQQEQQQQTQAGPAQAEDTQALQPDPKDASPVSKLRSHRVSKTSAPAGSRRPNLSRRRSSGTAESMDSDGHSVGNAPMAGSARQSSRGTSAPNPVKYTPVTGRVSRAKKGQPVHVCNQCDSPRIFTRAEHLRRHQLSHQKPAYPCTFEDCEKAFHRPDLLARHQNRHETQGEKAYKAGDPPSRESSPGSSESLSPGSKTQTPSNMEGNLTGQASQGADSGLPRTSSGGNVTTATHDLMVPGLGAVNFPSTSQQNQYPRGSVGAPAMGSTVATSSAPSIGHLATKFPSSMHNLTQVSSLGNMSPTTLEHMYTNPDTSSQMFPAVTTANGLPLLTLQVPEPPGLMHEPWYAESESTWSTPSERHPQWARDRSTSDATIPEHWTTTLVWESQFGSSSMAAQQTAGLEALPDSYDSPPYVSPLLSPHAYPLAGLSSPGGGYQELVGIPTLSGPYKSHAQSLSARSGRLSKSELARIDRRTNALVESSHLMSSTDEQAAVSLGERMEEYLVSYWTILEPIYDIIHPITFKLHARDVVKNAMAALGSQFHVLPGDRESGSRLHEDCTRMIVPHAAWDVQTMQAIYLTEVFGRFRSQKIDVRPSAVFRKLYKILVDSSAADSTSRFARFDVHQINAAVEMEAQSHHNADVPLSHEEVVEKLWQQWIEYEVRQRLRAACYMFDSHQRFCYEQRRCQPAVNTTNTFIVLPCPQPLWTATSSQEWYQHIQTLDCAAVRLVHPEIMDAEQISRLPLSSQADVGAIVFELLPSRDDLPLSSLNFDSNAGIINKIVSFFPEYIHGRGYIALYHTPLHHLLSLTGNTWLFGQKLTSHADIDAIAPAVRTWSSSPAAAVATWHACHLLRIMFDGDSDVVKPFHGVSEYWFLYTMTLIVWAFGHRTSSLSISGSTGVNTAHPGSSIALGQDDASRTRNAAMAWCDAMTELKPEQLQNALIRRGTGPVVDTARRRLREEAIMSQGRSGMLLDAVGVLDRIREGGRWF